MFKKTEYGRILAFFKMQQFWVLKKNFKFDIILDWVKFNTKEKVVTGVVKIIS